MNEPKVAITVLSAVSVGAVQPWNRPSSASAGEILQGIQAEAFFDPELPASVTTTVSTARTAGTAQAVTLSVTGLPAGVSASFSPSVVTAGTSRLTVYRTLASIE